ncbi:hypothetical protein PG999_013592 [Apiospora kogelbergensis]|uniref:Uncharacterized protein n=1 Tax=Apiospora kogelbergensis TaxID=1337665 RepID=A0AAW0QEU3_9PEZI
MASPLLSLASPAPLAPAAATPPPVLPVPAAERAPGDAQLEPQSQRRAALPQVRALQQLPGLRRRPRQRPAQPALPLRPLLPGPARRRLRAAALRLSHGHLRLLQPLSGRERRAGQRGGGLGRADGWAWDHITMMVG